MIHTNRCICGKDPEAHCPITNQCPDGDGYFCDSGYAALDAHKEELWEAINEYVEAKKEEKENRGNTNGRLIGLKIKDAYQRIESILNQIEKEKQDNPNYPFQGPSGVYFSPASDWHWKDGKFVLKRKYGKFKREIIKL